MALPKVMAFGVFTAAITSLVVIWSLYFTMWLQGETSITVYANHFGEFGIEFIGLTLAIIFLPVLFYEMNKLVFES